MPGRSGFSFPVPKYGLLQNAQGADTIGIGGVFGRFEGNRNMAHGGQIAYLVRLHLLDDANEIGRVGQVAIV